MIMPHVRVELPSRRMQADAGPASPHAASTTCVNPGLQRGGQPLQTAEGMPGCAGSTRPSCRMLWPVCYLAARLRATAGSLPAVCAVAVAARSSLTRLLLMRLPLVGNLCMCPKSCLQCRGLSRMCLGWRLRVDPTQMLTLRKASKPLGSSSTWGTKLSRRCWQPGRVARLEPHDSGSW